MDDVWCTAFMKHDRTSNHHWDQPLRKPVRTWMLPRMPLMLAGTPVYPSAAWCEATHRSSREFPDSAGESGGDGMVSSSAPPPNDPQEEHHVPPKMGRFHHPSASGLSLYRCPQQTQQRENSGAQWDPWWVVGVISQKWRCINQL